MGNEFEPTVIYEQKGGVLAVQAPDQKLEECLKAQKAMDAFAACGMNIELAKKLFLEYLSLPITNEEDQFTDESRTRKTEHVITREVVIKGESIKLLQVDFYPPAAEHGGATIGGVFTNTAEIILGLEGRGVLEVVPVITEEGKIFPDTAHSQDITIERGTLVILPPNVQGNRWKSLESNSEPTPSLRALFVAYPASYESAVTRKFDTKL